ncbi:L,D-transpeptidase [Anaerotignum lactatifermentans]|uniref:L,D-transpeptidase n=1 Tax=Anaerotignum lactatifermentans TaxID=160404 RepID=A0ABS2G965_9FIRM|nr:L,D-transpeptidase [Anaerotignum lactatifermentans]MBM6828776.1 L,D-transpeptidase [Anaerotignum lactatifermentans]MBM6877103.1 L,D-transpeptidase [Anaerotignum lactatifermentans]MBM6950358.1 L,D-transpeptidase [Anaerotignum lactatifermentans]
MGKGWMLFRGIFKRKQRSPESMGHAERRRFQCEWSCFPEKTAGAVPLERAGSGKAGIFLRGICFFAVFFLCCGIYSVHSTRAEGFPYEIEVNLSKNVVTVYRADENGEYSLADRAFVCSVGKATPTGVFRTTDKYEWRALFGNVFGQYATRITGSILFHSVPYFEMYDKGSLEYLEYNKLGTTASMGCVRLTVEDAKWIYDNCPSGTTVRIVKDGAVPITPEEPVTIDVNNMELRGWDPTDPDLSNPWRSQLPDHARLEKLTVKNPETSFWLEAFYGGGSYYLKAEDAKMVFGYFEKNLLLPTSLSSSWKANDKLPFLYGEKSYEVEYCIYDGVPYYKLRDLADISGITISWSMEKNERTNILLQDNTFAGRWEKLIREGRRIEQAIEEIS